MTTLEYAKGQSQAHLYMAEMYARNDEFGVYNREYSFHIERHYIFEDIIEALKLRGDTDETK